MSPSIRVLAGAIAITLLLLALRHGTERARWVAAIAAVGLVGLAAAADAHWSSQALAIASACLGTLFLLQRPTTHVGLRTDEGADAHSEAITSTGPPTDVGDDEREAVRFRLVLALLLIAAGTFGILLGRRAATRDAALPPPGAGVVDPAFDAELHRVRMLLELDAALATPASFAPDERATLEDARDALRRGAWPDDVDLVERLLVRHALDRSTSGSDDSESADQSPGEKSTPSDSR